MRCNLLLRLLLLGIALNGTGAEIVVIGYIPCHVGEFGCWNNGKVDCIEDTNQCDGHKVCDNDEENCETFNCTQTWSKCHDGKQCIRQGDFCEGTFHCKDKSDESPNTCSTHICDRGYIKCRDNLQCIHANAKCDGETTHCKDGSDEDTVNCQRPLGAACEFFAECGTGMWCKKEKCTCIRKNGCASDIDKRKDGSSSLHAPLMLMVLLVAMTSLVHARM